jgi:hypothetical protein
MEYYCVITKVDNVIDHNEANYGGITLLSKIGYGF